jgi:hypothetical protein
LTGRCWPRDGRSSAGRAACRADFMVCRGGLR